MTMVQESTFHLSLAQSYVSFVPSSSVMMEEERQQRKGGRATAKVARANEARIAKVESLPRVVAVITMLRRLTAVSLLARGGARIAQPRLCAPLPLRSLLSTSTGGPPRKPPPERRYGHDNGLYTKTQFAEAFGIQAWERAEPERRVAADGNTYTWAEFMEYYGGGSSTSDSDGIAYKYWNASKHWAHQMTKELVRAETTAEAKRRGKRLPRHEEGALKSAFERAGLQF
jgi:hypothetical protein